MELAAPITIHWDLPREGSDASRRLCADILSCRPLMLKLTDPAPRLGGETLAILELLRDSRCAVTLSITPGALDPEAVRLLAQTNLKELLLAADSLEPLQEWLQRGELRSGPMLGISFSVTRKNWRLLPGLISLCRDNSVDRLVFPMQRVWGGESPFFLSKAEQDELTAALNGVGGCRGIELTIHDPFLWRGLNPELPFPQGGCQAANTMLAVSPDGGVYPCPTLPVLLGSLVELPLKEIAQSPLKKEFRRSLLRMPRGCDGCTELSSCRGGCRGRGLLVHGSLEGGDPACR